MNRRTSSKLEQALWREVHGFGPRATRLQPYGVLGSELADDRLRKSSPPLFSLCAQMTVVVTTILSQSLFTNAQSITMSVC